MDLVFVWMDLVFCSQSVKGNEVASPACSSAETDRATKGSLASSLSLPSNAESGPHYCHPADCMSCSVSRVAKGAGAPLAMRPRLATTSRRCLSHARAMDSDMSTPPPEAHRDVPPSSAMSRSAAPLAEPSKRASGPAPPSSRRSSAPPSVRKRLAHIEATKGVVNPFLTDSFGREHDYLRIR